MSEKTRTCLACGQEYPEHWSMGEHEHSGPMASQACVARLCARIEALEKVVAWWSECKRFEDGKVEP